MNDSNLNFLNSMRCRLVHLVFLAAVLVPSPEACAGNWPQWRGPAYNGSSPDRDLPVRWSKTENVVCVAPLPGPSGATPAIWEDHVFVSSPDAQKNLNLICLDRRDGKVRWQRQVATGDRKEGKNNMATPSPVTDGQSVFVMFGTGDLAAFDFNGKQLWSRNLARQFGKFANMFMYGASPLLYNGRLYIQVLQRNPPTYPHAVDDKPERESFILCLDPQTGKDLWRHVRKTDALAESMETYSTPFPYEGRQRTEIIVVGGDCVTGHDAATGSELWRCGGLNSKKSEWWRIVTSAVGGDGFVYACAPKREPLIAIKECGSGIITDTHVAWRLQEFTPDVCTPLLYEKKMFVLDGDRQMLTRLNPQTGAKIWQGHLGVRETFSASPTGADGKIYCISERGTAVVLEAGDSFKILSTISMGEEPCKSSVAVAHQQLFIRTAQNLYCITADNPAAPR